MNPLVLSLTVATMALINVVICGLALAFLLRQWRSPITALLESIITLPLVLPPVVVGFALLMVFSPGYAFGAWLEAHNISIVFSINGAIIASSVIAFPLFYQTVRSALDSIDHRIEDVGRTLGASEWRVYWTLSIPLAWKGIVTGAILAFCRAMGEFGATILIAGNMPGLTRTMPLAIYSFVEAGQYDDAFQQVVYICILTLMLLCTIQWLTKGRILGGGK